MPATPKESSACPGGYAEVGVPSTEGERGRVPEKIPFMAVAGDGDDGMFIFKERSDGGGDGEAGTGGDGNEMVVEGLVW